MCLSKRVLSKGISSASILSFKSRLSNNILSGVIWAYAANLLLVAENLWTFKAVKFNMLAAPESSSFGVNVANLGNFNR